MDLGPAVTTDSARQQFALADSPHNFYGWCMFALLATLLLEMMGSVAFVEVVLPPELDNAHSHLMFNIASGVIATVTLFSIFICDDRRKSERAQQQMLHKLERESASGCRVIDHDTNTFTSEYFDQVLLREIGRTSISAKTFCVLRCSLGHSGTGPQRDVISGYLETRLAHILRSSVRASDVVAHTAKCEFTILLAETNEHLAQIPMGRIRHAAECWNRSSNFQYRMRLKLGFCEYDRHSTPQELSLRVSQRCHLDQYMLGSSRHRIPAAEFTQEDIGEETRHVC